jgi:uncharacterized short protein YbdD (DUF466 family)
MAGAVFLYNMSKTADQSQNIIEDSEEDCYRTYKENMRTQSPKTPTHNEEHNCFKRRNEWEERYASKNIPDF